MISGDAGGGGTVPTEDKDGDLVTCEEGGRRGSRNSMITTWDHDGFYHGRFRSRPRIQDNW